MASIFLLEWAQDKRREDKLTIIIDKRVLVLVARHQKKKRVVVIVGYLVNRIYRKYPLCSAR